MLCVSELFEGSHVEKKQQTTEYEGGGQPQTRVYSKEEAERAQMLQ